MSDSVKMISVLIGLSIVLLLLQTNMGIDKPFGKDILNEWFQMDDHNNFVSESDNITQAKEKFYQPSSSSSNAGIQVSNFWDVTQIIWGFIKMIFNLMFAIPFSLLSLANMPPILKTLLAVPLGILAISIFIIRGVFGKG